MEIEVDKKKGSGEGGKDGGKEGEKEGGRKEGRKEGRKGNEHVTFLEKVTGKKAIKGGKGRD